MAGFDAVFVGSGINSLAGAALLAKAGWKVCVLERNEWLGGAIRTVDGLIEPGFTHEVFASWHPLWTGSPAYAELKPDLDRLGVEYLNTELATGSAFPDGSSVFLSTDGAANAAELGDAWPRQFDEFMANADLAFGVLGTELWSTAGLGLGRQAYARFGRRGLLEFGGRVLTTARDWLTETFDDEAAHGLLAPWVLHTGLGPDQATSGFMTQVIACALQLGGMPVPRGGGVKLVDGLATIVREAGGELRTESEVERIVVSDGRATAVRLAGGETIAASRAVLACVTPTQLYGRLLSEGNAPANVREAARRFRYGRGEMQIHLALDELPRWRGDERLARTPIVHVTPGLDGVSRAVNEAERGLLPAEATIVCGQPLAVDPSRAPEGKGHPLDPAPGAAVGAEGRCRGRARDGERLGRAAPRGVCRSDRGAARRPHREPELGDARARRARPCRDRRGEPELGRRRHLRRLVRARPEPALAADSRDSGPRDAGRAPLPHRREHASRAWTRRGLRLPHREATDAAAASASPALEAAGSLMPLSLSEISTPGASFRDDLRAYAAAGFDGIGIWESKLGDDESDLAAFRESGLRATNCVPLVPSILPNAVIEGPLDVEERIESLCASMVRFARYEPESVPALDRPGRGPERGRRAPSRRSGPATRGGGRCDCGGANSASSRSTPPSETA